MLNEDPTLNLEIPLYKLFPILSFLQNAKIIRCSGKTLLGLVVVIKGIVMI